MAMDEVELPRSRRAVLAAAVGAMAATAAQALGRPTAALATNGQAVIQGQLNSGSALTTVASSSTTALQCRSDAANFVGVFGFAFAQTGAATYGVEGVSNSPSGAGVYGTSSVKGVYGTATAGQGAAYGVHGAAGASLGIGVLGENVGSALTTLGVLGTAKSGVGVQGFSGTGKLPAVAGNAGVHGECSANAFSSGVRGFSEGGIGVYGSTTSGTALIGLASDPSATGLAVQGKATFSRSGKATVLAGHSTVVVTNVPVTSSSLVLATIQGAGETGLYVRSVVATIATSQLTIKLSKVTIANTKVGWFVVN